MQVIRTKSRGNLLSEALGQGLGNMVAGYASALYRGQLSEKEFEQEMTMLERKLEIKGRQKMNLMINRMRMDPKRTMQRWTMEAAKRLPQEERDHWLLTDELPTELEKARKGLSDSLKRGDTDSARRYMAMTYSLGQAGEQPALTWDEMTQKKASREAALTTAEVTADIMARFRNRERLEEIEYGMKAAGTRGRKEVELEYAGVIKAAELEAVLKTKDKMLPRIKRYTKAISQADEAGELLARIRAAPEMTDIIADRAGKKAGARIKAKLENIGALKKIKDTVNAKGYALREKGIVIDALDEMVTMLYIGEASGDDKIAQSYRNAVETIISILGLDMSVEEVERGLPLIGGEVGVLKPGESKAPTPEKGKPGARLEERKPESELLDDYRGEYLLE